MASCATRPPPPPHPGVKSGAYYLIHDGHENILQLGPDARFSYRYSAPPRPDSPPYSFERRGRYVVEGTNLWL